MEKISTAITKLDSIIFFLPDETDFGIFGSSKTTIKCVLENDFESLLYKNDKAVSEPLYLTFNSLCRAFWIVADSLNTNLENIQKFEKLAKYILEHEGSIVEGFSNLEILQLLAFTNLNLFIKENWTGPSFTHINTEKWYQKERVQPSDPRILAALKEKRNNGVEGVYNKFKQILDELDIDKETFIAHDFEHIQDPLYVTKLNSDVFRSFFMIDGEDCYKSMRYMHIYLGVKKILETSADDSFTTCLLRGRLAYLHTQLMLNPTNSLKEVIEQNYGRVLNIVEKNPDSLSSNLKACLYVEYGSVILHYYGYAVSEEYFEKARNTLQLKLNFTGKMGVRTKYQSFKVAQLTIEVEKGNLSSIKDEEDEESKDTPINNIALESIQDNILYERPKLDEEQEEDNLSVFDHIAILGTVRHLKKTTPMDDAQREYVMAYSNKTLEKFKNWSVYTKTLLVRSMEEFDNWKKRERAILQLEQLSKDWNSGDCSLRKRLKYFWFLDYPSFVELLISQVEKYEAIGLYMSSCQIYEQVGMFEEAVGAYYKAGHKDRAKNLAEELIKTTPTPNLYCVLGDIYKDPSHYHKALEITDGKYARALRSLGHHYYNAKQLDESKEWYEKAILQNNFHPRTWSILGFIYMNQANYKQSIRCYSHVVQQDPSVGGAWANLAGLYNKIGEDERAFKTMENAVKLQENNFMMWMNYMIFAIAAKRFSAYIRGLNTLLNLNKKDLIDEVMVNRLNMIILFEIEESKKAIMRNIRNAENFSIRIEETFKRLIHALPQNPYIWEAYSDFQHFKYQIYVMKFELRKREKEHNIEQPVPLREEPTIDVEEVRKSCLQTRFDLTLKQCQAVMKIGWEIEVADNIALFNSTLRLIEFFEQTRDEEMLKKLKLQINAIKPTLQKTIGDKVDLESLTLD